MKTRRWIILLLAVLLAATLLTWTAAAGPGEDLFIQQLQGAADDATVGMKCETVVDLWRPRLIVATVICRTATDLG